MANEIRIKAEGDRRLNEAPTANAGGQRQAQAGIQRNGHGGQPEEAMIDLSNDDDMYFMSLDKSMAPGQVFEAVRAEYSLVFKQASKLIQHGRGKKEAGLRRAVYRTGFEVGSGDRAWFAECSPKIWPSFLAKAKEALEAELDELQEMEERLFDPGYKATFQPILDEQRGKLQTLEEGRQRACKLIADLKKAERYM